MRALPPYAVVIALMALAGGAEQPRVEGFTATGPRSFLYEAHTNTVMTPNEDGDAERIRRYWIPEAAMVNALCTQADAVAPRRFVPDPFGNGGAIRYSGRCL